MKRVLFINYIQNGEKASGSSVRPMEMLNAFEQVADEVFLLSGNQIRTERAKKIRKIKKIIKQKKIDLCYIESPTYPIMWHCDRALIRFIHKKKIPIGYFYRDFYRKFPELLRKREGFIEKCKDLVLDGMQILTDRCLKNCDIVYFPSLEASKLFQYKRMDALPPAGKNITESTPSNFNYIGIYVGGITGHYDGELLLSTYKRLYEMDAKFRLILICRKNEWQLFEKEYGQAPWLTVAHVSGAELNVYYEQASYALHVPKISEKYNHFAVSVKIFEYMQHGLPIISVSNGAVERFIRENSIGCVTSSETMADAIFDLSENQDLYKAYCNNSISALMERNLWVHRAQKVITDLENIRE